MTKTSAIVANALETGSLRQLCLCVCTFKKYIYACVYNSGMGDAKAIETHANICGKKICQFYIHPPANGECISFANLQNIQDNAS